MAYATISLNTINTNATTKVVALVFFGIANCAFPRAIRLSPDHRAGVDDQYAYILHVSCGTSSAADNTVYSEAVRR